MQDAAKTLALMKARTQERRKKKEELKKRREAKKMEQRNALDNRMATFMALIQKMEPMFQVFYFLFLYFVFCIFVCGVGVKNKERVFLIFFN